MADLTRDEVVTIMKARPEVDLYLGADMRSWFLTSGYGSVPVEVVDHLLRAGLLARKWAEMPCYYTYGDRSIEKVVPRRHERFVPAVRDVSVALAVAEYRDYERRQSLRRQEERQAKSRRPLKRTAP